MRLYRHPHPESQINQVAKLSACLSVADLAGILLAEGDPVFYTETWGGLLPIYFFTYGQMFMTIAETLIFGLSSMIILPLSGYLIGIEAAALMPSILILLIGNTFGFCTRCQLEKHSRNLFRERRKAECAAEDKTLFLRHLSHNLRAAASLELLFIGSRSRFLEQTRRPITAHGQQNGLRHRRTQ